MFRKFFSILLSGFIFFLFIGISFAASGGGSSKSYTDLYSEAKKYVLRAKKLEEKDETITGFNIGMNSGESAGQTVMHAHIHLIPRRKGDTPNPRGGVRGVIPEKMSY